MSKPKRTPMAWVWIGLCTILGITGAGQMPIFKRYYIADIPGLAWTADFAVTHAMHYIAAAIFLGLVCYYLPQYLLQRKWRMTRLGAWRVGMIVVLIVTGAFRVAKNMPDAWFSPEFVMAIDWTHLAAAMGLGVFAFLAKRAKQPYVE